MKTLSKLFMACGLIVGLAACNKELAPEVNSPELPQQDNIYMAFNISMPATRSTTDPSVDPQHPSTADPNIEVGTELESSIKHLRLVLVNPTDKKIVALSSPTLKRNALGEYICPFQSEELVNASNAASTTKLNVFAFCGKALSGIAADDFGQKVGDVLNVDKLYSLSGAEDATLWEENEFAMVNVAAVSFDLPKTNDLVTLYKDERHPFDLGTITVERLAARFDLDVTPAHTVFTMPGGLVKITLEEAALYNQSKSMYVIRRGNATGVNAADVNTNWTDLFAFEQAANWYMVDDLAAEKNAFALQVKADPKAELANRADFFVDAAAPKYEQLSAIASNEDSYAGTYSPWKYAVENVFPAPDGCENQVQKLTTLVSYRGKISPAEGCPADLADDFNGQPVYIHDGIMYGNLERLQRAVKGDYKDPSKTGPEDEKFVINDKLVSSYNLAVGSKTNPEEVAAALKASTEFQVFEGEYHVYYNYLNRHNNNGKDNETASMEYAVVRNNVYKLAVTTIKNYGLPEFHIEGPDETSNAYFTVDVKVLPWTVRINDIEF